jgi:hypothetical protein
LLTDFLCWGVAITVLDTFLYYFFSAWECENEHSLLRSLNGWISFLIEIILAKPNPLKLLRSFQFPNDEALYIAIKL